jgi:hypothetical protein
MNVRHKTVVGTSGIKEYLKDKINKLKETARTTTSELPTRINEFKKYYQLETIL